MLNILTNAIKFTDRDGKVVIYIEYVDSKPKNSIKVFIIDNGIGIKKKNKPQLFKLVEGKNRGISTKGIGLGLSVSKLIVENLGGHIDFAS